MPEIIAKKSMGQHWLNDEVILSQIVEYAGIHSGDKIIEVGPGQGTLTAKLLESGAEVIAVEYDRDIYNYLNQNKSKIFKDKSAKLILINEDILKYRFDQIEEDYKVVANIPYYLTSNLIRILSELPNPPKTIVLLIQKEVALRLCAKPGQMSLLSLWAQIYYECSLGIEVSASFFSPPPKVDSQVVIMNLLNKPRISRTDNKVLSQLASAAFNSKRKTLQNSLATGLNMSKSEIEYVLTKSGIKITARPQELSVSAWQKIIENLHT